MSVIVPISRKISFVDFKEDDDIAFLNTGSHYSNKTKFILYEKCIYRIKENIVDEKYSTPEYIIKKKANSVDGYKCITEFSSIPTAKIIKITSIDSDDLTYCDQEYLNEYIKSLNLNLLIGRAVFINGYTLIMIKNITLEILCEKFDEYENYPICEITNETIISFEKNINSSKKVSQIVELDDTNVIDIIVSDCKENNQNNQKNDIELRLEKIYSSLEYMVNMANPIQTSSNVQKIYYTTKTKLLEKIKQMLSLTSFKLKSTFKVTVDSCKFEIKIDSINFSNSNDIAYKIKHSNVHININNLAKDCLILDLIYDLKETDELNFNIIGSKGSVYLDEDIKKQITIKMENEILFLKGHQFDAYIGKEKIILTLEDIFIKSTNEYNYLDNVAYTYQKNCNTLININDNVTHEIYVLDSLEKFELLSVSFNISKRETITNNNLAELFKIIKTTDVDLNKIRRYLKYKVKDATMFIGRIFEYEGIVYTVEDMEYANINVSKQNKKIGVFSESTNISFNKNIQNKSINLIDVTNQTSRNLDITHIKELAKQMETEGLYGMTEHVNKFIKEVLLTRTSLVDDNLMDFIEPTKGVLLYGAPGTGKTTLARNLGKIFGAYGTRINRITATEIKSKWHGESEGNIRNLFKDAINEYNVYGKNAQLHILIIDEIDAIIGSRDTGTNSDIKNSIVNQFLGEMDGLVQFDNCIIIGITNRIDTIDQACLRPGRFGCHIHVGLPNKDQRKLIFESFHRKLEKTKVIENMELFDYELIANKTEGLSGASIKNIYQLCVSEHINKKIEGIFHIIDQQMIFSILKHNYNININ